MKTRLLVTGLILALVAAALFRSLRQGGETRPEPGGSERGEVAAPTRSGPEIVVVLQPRSAGKSPLRLRFHFSERGAAADHTTEEVVPVADLPLLVPVPEPVPAPPLKVSILGDRWHTPPAAVEFEIHEVLEGTTRFELELVPSRVVTLTVLDAETGAPVSGARVRDRQGRALTEAAADGFVELRLSELRDELLLVDSPGHLASGAWCAAGEIRLPAVELVPRVRGGTISVTVADPDGQPLPCALVRWRWSFREPLELSAAGRAVLVPLDWRLARDNVATRAETDENGRIEIPTFAEGGLKIFTSHPDLGRGPELEIAADELPEPPAVLERTVRYGPRTALEVATTSAGDPIPQCPVELVERRGTAFQRLRAVETGEDGTAALDLPEGPDFLVVARPTQLAPAVVPVTEVLRREGRLTLELEPGRDVQFAIDGILDLEVPKRRIEVIHESSGVVLAYDLPDRRATYYLARLPVGVPLSIVRSVDRATGRALISPLIVGAGAEPLDLGRLNLPD